MVSGTYKFISECELYNCKITSEMCFCFRNETKKHFFVLSECTTDNVEECSSVEECSFRFISYQLRI